MKTAFLPLIFALAGPVAAQEEAAQPQCGATPVAPPVELAGWSVAQPIKAATSVEASGSAQFMPGKAADLALAPTLEVKYAIRPEHPGGSVSSGGIAAIQIERAGTYRVAIDSGAWLDLIANGKSLESVGHGRGPACTGIRKMVDFKLEPGRYLLQIAGNGTPRIRVLVTPTPGA
jgi:hypothetical protein